MLLFNDMVAGRFGEAIRRNDRSIAFGEESARAFPDSLQLQYQYTRLLYARALIEVKAGRPKNALISLHRQLERSQALCHNYPRIRFIRGPDHEGCCSEELPPYPGPAGCSESRAWSSTELR